MGFRYIIYSKNRAMQLDCAIRTALEQVEDLEMIYVIYTYDNEGYRQGYERLKSKVYPKVTLIEESTFKSTLSKVSKELPQPYIFFMADDDYWVKKTIMQPLIDLFLSNNKFMHFTVRMSDKITKRGVVLTDMPLPKFIRQDDFLIWDWTESKPMDDWGYPVCTTMGGFTKKHILPWVTDLEYKNSGDLEGQWNQRMRNPDMPLMCSFNDCKIVNLPLNRVVVGAENPHGDMHTGDLNRMYLDNKIIELESIYEAKVENAYMNYSPTLRFI